MDVWDWDNSYRYRTWYGMILKVFIGICVPVDAWISILKIPSSHPLGAGIYQVYKKGKNSQVDVE